MVLIVEWPKHFTGERD